MLALTQAGAVAGFPSCRLDSHELSKHVLYFVGPWTVCPHRARSHFSARRWARLRSYRRREGCRVRYAFHSREIGRPTVPVTCVTSTRPRSDLNRAITVTARESWRAPRASPRADGTHEHGQRFVGAIQQVRGLTEKRAADDFEMSEACAPSRDERGHTREDTVFAYRDDAQLVFTVERFGTRKHPGVGEHRQLPSAWPACPTRNRALRARADSE
jgi:hypothetical protein